MKWILILGALIAIIWIFYLKKSKSNNSTLTTEEILEKPAMLDVMKSSKQDESFSPPTGMKTYPTKVVGVTHKNPDGTDRQKIIKNCKEGEQIDLIREPDNPHHVSAIAVFRKTGEQIGYISQDDSFSHPDVDL